MQVVCFSWGEVGERVAMLLIGSRNCCLVTATPINRLAFLSKNGSGLTVGALDSESSGPGLSPGRGHCVVFLGKTLYSHSSSLHSGV